MESWNHGIVPNSTYIPNHFCSSHVSWVRLCQCTIKLFYHCSILISCNLPGSLHFFALQVTQSWATSLLSYKTSFALSVLCYSSTIHLASNNIATYCCLVFLCGGLWNKRIHGTARQSAQKRKCADSFQRLSFWYLLALGIFCLYHISTLCWIRGLEYHLFKMYMSHVKNTMSTKSRARSTFQMKGLGKTGK